MVDGVIERSADGVTFRYQRVLSHPVPVVWRAITDPAEIAAWIGNRPEIDLTEGGEYVTYHGPGPDRMRVVDRIVRVEPPTLLQHTFWQQTNPSVLVTWMLSPAGDGCRLELTHYLSNADIEAAASSVAAGDDIITILSRNGAGWHRLLDELAAAIAGRDGPWSPADQESLRERYAAQLA